MGLVPGRASEGKYKWLDIAPGKSTFLFDGDIEGSRGRRVRIWGEGLIQGQLHNLQG